MNAVRRPVVAAFGSKPPPEKGEEECGAPQRCRCHWSDRIPTCAKIQEMICGDDRAHPGPLPKEREKRSPRFLEYRATGLAGQSFANHKTCDGFSFSPGEKAGMRADVKTNLQWSATFRSLQGAKAEGSVISMRTLKRREPRAPEHRKRDIFIERHPAI